MTSQQASAPASPQTFRPLPLPVEIDHARRAATVGGRNLMLGARAFDLLAVLASQPGRVFADDELIAAVWPGRVVELNNLRVQIAALRKQLGARAIVNVAGRGYALAPPAAGAATARDAAPRTSRLPRPLETLLGREPELAALLALLRGHRLVTLLGAGGIGKTRLAQAAALQLESHHADGVCWVDLAPLTAAPQIAPAIAQAVDLQTGALDGADAALRLGFALAGRDTLLVIDNAEHLAASLAPLLHTILQAAPTLQLLVTSQQLLELPGEQVCRLDPLPVPPPGATPAEARASAALQLLERRAQAADHRFAFSDAHLPEACALCRQLDGIPLAIEMAGARLPVLGLAALNERLGERLRLLSGDAHTVLPRHRTLRAALDWSHALLSADEQAVLRRLSVFAAPFRLASAQHVAADAKLDAPAALQAIVGLANKSLLQVQRAEPTRYRLLDSTRLYAAQALAQHGETAATEARHAQAMAALADVAQAGYWRTADAEWLDQWRADHEDLQLGFDRAAAAGDAGSAALIGEALHGIANLIGMYGAVTSRLPAALALLEGAAPLVQARLWNRFASGGLPGLSMVEAARRRVAAWRVVGEPMALARALAALANQSVKVGDARAADAALAETCALDDASWPPRQRAMSVPLAAFFVAAHRGDAAGLRESMLASLELAEAGGAQRMVAQAHANLAQAAMLEGDGHAAVALLHRAVAEFRALDCGLDVGHNLANLCAALAATGDTAAARDAAEQALLLVRDTTPLCYLFEPLMLLAWRMHRREDAARMLAASDTLRSRHAIPRQQLDERIAAEVRAGLAGTLSDAEQAALVDESARLDAASLREAALAWLRAAR